MNNREMTKRYSESKKRGCPTCGGIDAKSCMRCKGKTKMCDWYWTDNGMAHVSQIEQAELGRGMKEQK